MPANRIVDADFLTSSPSPVAVETSTEDLKPTAEPSPVGSFVQLVQHQDDEPETATVLSNPESITAPIPQNFPTAVAQPVDYFVEVALSSHPRIRAARARVTAASHRAPQASSLDDPLLTNSFYPISDQALQTAAGRAGNTLSLSQKYPWPEKRWTKAAVADRETNSGCKAHAGRT